MQHREDLEKIISSKLETLVGRPNKQQNLVMQLANNWDMPIGEASDLVSMKKGLIAESNFVIYVIASELKISNLSHYYSKTEREELKGMKFITEKLAFPIVWDMIQITSDQWIGSIMVSEIMKLRDAQIITYNENTQRTIERVVRGSKEWWRISTNNKAVDEIADEYLENQFIPNTLTFNIPESASFTYNNDSKQLIIKELSNLDIIDGYHRYLGAQKASIKDSSFDYPMELRIVFWPENKAKQFIWQEDQKTKMTKLDSESFNQYEYGNTIVQYLNVNPEFIANGMIGKRGIIDAGYMGQIINGLYFTSVKEKGARERYLKLRKYLVPILNEIIEEEPSLLEKRWDYQTTLALMYVVLFWGKSDGSMVSLFKKFRDYLNNEYKGIRFQDGLTGSKKTTLNSIYNKCKEER